MGALDYKTRRHRRNRLAAELAATYSPRRHFRLGQDIGWHWQFDNPLTRVGIAYEWVDTAGTTPSTAVGQGIGLLLGREYGGVRGVELLSNRSFASGSTGWVVTTPGVNTITISGGSARFQATGSADAATLVQAVTLTAGKVFEVGFDVLAGSSGALKVLPVGGATGEIQFACTPGRKTFVSPVNTTNSFIISRLVGQAADAYLTNFSVREIPGTHLTQATGTAKPTLSARVNLLLSTATMSTQNVTTVATSYKLSFTGTGTVTLSGTSTAGPLVGTGANDRVSLTFTPTAGTLTLTVSGSVTLADLRTADDAAKNIPAYQRVGATASDHDTDGFPHGVYPDGTDDSGTTATGGGNTTGFFYCGALTVSGGAGTARTIWSDTGTNTGYRVRINASNKLELAAGNGSAYTTVQSNETITAPGTYLLSAWDDGGVLAVQVNNLAPATTTRPTVSAGTAAITAYKDNGAASSYFNGRDYGSVYRQQYPGETAHNRIKRYLANVARITA